MLDRFLIASRSIKPLLLWTPLDSFSIHRAPLTVDTSRQILDSYFLRFKAQRLSTPFNPSSFMIFYIYASAQFSLISPRFLSTNLVFSPSQTHFSLKTSIPEAFRPRDLFISLVWFLLFHLSCIHLFLTKLLGFLKDFGIFQNIWGFRKNFGLGFT